MERSDWTMRVPGLRSLSAPTAWYLEAGWCVLRGRSVIMRVHVAPLRTGLVRRNHFAVSVGFYP